MAPPKPSQPAGATSLDGAIAALKPVLTGALAAVDAAGPYVMKAWSAGAHAWARLEAFGGPDMAQVVLGLLLLFCGGQFPVLIAAIEAVRMAGWESMKHAIKVLYRQYKVAMAASRKDDAVDDNRDGVPDVQQINAKELATRKLAVFLKSADPAAVNEGMHGLGAGLTAVAATLKMRFARTVTLGVAMGDIFIETQQRVLQPSLQRAVPVEYHRWLDVGVVYVCRALAVTIAWWCARIIGSLHCALRGAQMVLRGVCKVLEKRGVQLAAPPPISPSNPLFPMVCTALGSLGFYTQVVRGFSLPFPLNIILMPLRVAEWLVFFLVSYAT